MADQFLIKNTMADMRALSAAEITALTSGTYSGVQLLGYYQTGDTPSPIIYYYFESDTTADNGGSIIELIQGRLKHQFAEAMLDVRYFGAKGDGIQDDTKYIQNALNTKKDIFFPHTGQSYMIMAHHPGRYALNTGYLTGEWLDQGGLDVKSNQTLLFETGASLKAIPTNHNAYHVIKIVNKINVTIINATIFGERKEHFYRVMGKTEPDPLIQKNTAYTVDTYLRDTANRFLKIIQGGTSPNTEIVYPAGTDVGSTVVWGDIKFVIIGVFGENGYGVAVLGSSNVKLQGCKAHDFWGDGFNIQFYNGECYEEENLNTDGNNHNVQLEGCHASNNRRQGLSIEALVGGRVSNCIFEKTNGTAPQSGMDIEPWRASNHCRDIIVENCLFKECSGAGFIVDGFAEGGVKDIIFRNCVSDGNYVGFNIERQAENVSIDNITFKNITMWEGSIRGAVNLQLRNSNLEDFYMRTSEDNNTDNAYATKSVTLSNCHLKNATIEVGVNTDNFVFTNNTVRGSAGNREATLILRGGDSVISKNTVMELSKPFVLTTNQQPPKSTSILNNDFINLANTCLNIQSYNFISGNKFLYTKIPSNDVNLILIRLGGSKNNLSFNELQMNTRDEVGVSRTLNVIEMIGYNDVYNYNNTIAHNHISSPYLSQGTGGIQLSVIPFQTYMGVNGLGSRLRNIYKDHKGHVQVRSLGTIPAGTQEGDIVCVNSENRTLYEVITPPVINFANWTVTTPAVVRKIIFNDMLP